MSKYIHESLKRIFSMMKTRMATETIYVYDRRTSFIPFNQVMHLFQNDLIADYKFQPDLQHYANPGDQVITLIGKNGIIYVARVRYENGQVYPSTTIPDMTNYTIIVRTPENQITNFTIDGNELLGQLISEIILKTKLINDKNQDLIHNNTSLYEYDLESAINRLNLGNPIQIEMRKSTGVLKTLDILKKLNNYGQNHNIEWLQTSTGRR